MHSFRSRITTASYRRSKEQSQRLFVNLATTLRTQYKQCTSDYICYQTKWYIHIYVKVFGRLFLINTTLKLAMHLQPWKTMLSQRWFFNVVTTLIFRCRNNVDFSMLSQRWFFNVVTTLIVQCRHNIDFSMSPRHCQRNVGNLRVITFVSS